MANSRGTPLEGDRGAFDTVDHADKHALDIQNDALLRHLPEPGDAGSYARSDGTNWQRQLGLVLADLIGYVRGAIIRGGVTAWEVLTIGVAGKVLKSDGTDAAWGDVDHSELTGVGADDHHTAFTSADIDTLAKLNAIVADATLDDAGDPRTDTNAIHDNVAGEIHAIADKAAPADADEIVIEDSEDTWSKKRVAIGELRGGSGSGANLLFSQVVDVTVADTTDETTLLGSGRGTKTLTADILAQGSVIVIVGHGYLSTNGTPTLNLKVTLGGTLVCSTGAVTLADTISDQGFTFRAEIVCRSTGAGGSVVAGGTFEYSSGNQHKLPITSATAINTTLALVMDVTATWGTAHASNAATCQVATIELIAADDLAVAAPGGLTATEV